VAKETLLVANARSAHGCDLNMHASSFESFKYQCSKYWRRLSRFLILPYFIYILHFHFWRFLTLHQNMVFMNRTTCNYCPSIVM
jgi:hypothetical protein